MADQPDTILHESITHFFDTLSQDLVQAIMGTGGGECQVQWNQPGQKPFPFDLLWWSGKRSTEPDGAFFCGAAIEAWEEIGRGGESGNAHTDAYALLGRCFQNVLQQRFGPSVLDDSTGPSDAPSEKWTAAILEIQREENSFSLYCVLSPQLDDALRGGEDPPQAPEPVRAPAALGPLEMLAHVQVPVSVSFGSTRMHLRELLSLSAGSIVELDQALGDPVEVRVNNCVIARGEVVAVDGNYGVRVVELTSPKGKSGEDD